MFHIFCGGISALFCRSWPCTARLCGLGSFSIVHSVRLHDTKGYFLMQLNPIHRTFRTARTAMGFSALCYGCAVGGILISQAMPVLAQEKTETAPSPKEFLGKTFAKCEKLLGKPSLIATPFDPGQKQKYFIRFYKSHCPGMTRIILERTITMEHYGAPPPKTVNEVIYEFPKGTKTWQQAFALIGVSSQGVQAKEFSYNTTVDSAGVKVTQNDIGLSAIAGLHRAEWIFAEDENNPDGDGVVNPHPDDDCLVF